MPWVVLATEDELSEEVGRALAGEAGIEIGQCLRRGGSGYLRSRIPNFCQMAMQQPVLVLADLDQVACASRLLASWFGAKTRPQNLLLRVAVREVEAWLLSDHEAMRALLGRGATRLPSDPDTLTDPKRSLLTLAQGAPRDVRDDLLVQHGAIASQGLGYNARLCQVVRDAWRPERAATRSPSLAKARHRLRELAERMGLSK